MKILQINSDFRYGSTGKITGSLHDMLSINGIESYVCYGRDLKINEEKAYPTISVFFSKFEHLICNLFGDPYSFCFFSTKKVKNIIRSVNPDIIHIQCINGYFVNNYSLLKWIAKKKYNVVITLHAEYLYTGGCDHAIDCEKWKNECYNCYQNKYLPIYKKKRTKLIFKKFENCFNLFDVNKIRVVSVSNWLMNRANKSKILSRFKHSFVLNGVDTRIFYKRNQLDIEKVKDEYNIEGDYLLFITAIFNPNSIEDNKGSNYVLRIANRLLNSNKKIVIASSYYSIDSSLPSNILFLGRVTDQNNLASLYSGASVTLLTSKRETFGMTVSESLCCGTPVAGFKAGGPESFALEEETQFVEYGNIEALVAAIQKLEEKNFDREKISQKAKKEYSDEKMCLDYIKVYSEMEK